MYSLHRRTQIWKPQHRSMSEHDQTFNQMIHQSSLTNISNRFDFITQSLVQIKQNLNAMTDGLIHFINV